ncbi:PREDICTED: uncharacterized protein LOC106742057 [Dinoponera quadriceps]|uniref:Uncharacterized protein LOC106742057 n=1 Tax=Dinoponera quadriceps TaxID=609295 RepID=A0A6P3WVE9_DINQU|nr:PREDICTED: uncharacterized protein LOC106742057 [Dinoponera quadriceps]
MRCSALCVLLLTISEPLLVHAKVVLVVPRHVRRSPGMPWRPPSAHYKKSSFGGNDFHRQAYYSYGNRHYNRKPYRPLPHGGDDFDQGHEAVNHVQIPYGKDVSRGVSFGKGYIPYENIKSSSLPFVHERYAGAYPRQPAVPDYPPSSFTSVGQEYAASASANYDSPHVDSFFSDMESATRSELHDALKDTTNKYYASRSIEKALSNVADPLAKGNELARDTSPAAYGHAATNVAVGMQGAVVLPAGIPPATIAGNKDGIVLRDSVSLDEYHKKLEELTKSWPSVLSSNYPGTHQPLNAVDHFPSPAGLPVGWLSGFAQPKQGYAVREDHAEPPVSHDFRTMPVHTAPYHSPNVGVPVVPHHG